VGRGAGLSFFYLFKCGKHLFLKKKNYNSSAIITTWKIKFQEGKINAVQILSNIKK
jgi:hypothetical protein